MADWRSVGENMWLAVLEEVRNLRSKGCTLEEITKKLGSGSTTLISLWLKGDKKAENASFGSLMSYVENLGMNYRDFFPSEKEDKVACAKRIRELEAEVMELRIYRYKWEGHLEALAAQAGQIPMKKTAG